MTLPKVQLLPRPAGRPANYADLLLTPINDQPEADPVSMSGWELAHTPHRRFFLAGSLWFENNAGLNANRVAIHREAAAARIEAMTEAGEINWRKLPGTVSDPRKYWRDISRQQINVAFRGEPIFFSKAMTVIMACELAVAEALQSGLSMPHIFGPRIEKATDVYKGMAIIPSCWSVSGFDKQHLDAAVAAEPGIRQEIADACGQPQSAFLDELAMGATVQYTTACAVADFCKNHRKLFGKDFVVRARSNTHGRAKAAACELIDRG